MTRSLDVALDRTVPETLAREVLAKLRYVAEGVSGAELDAARRSIRMEFELSDALSRLKKINSTCKFVSEVRLVFVLLSFFKKNKVTDS